jgi:hypothetical protein
MLELLVKMTRELVYPWGLIRIELEDYLPYLFFYNQVREGEFVFQGDEFVFKIASLIYSKVKHISPSSDMVSFTLVLHRSALYFLWKKEAF